MADRTFSTVEDYLRSDLGVPDEEISYLAPIFKATNLAPVGLSAEETRSFLNNTSDGSPQRLLQDLYDKQSLFRAQDVNTVSVNSSTGSLGNLYLKAGEDPARFSSLLQALGLKDYTFGTPERFQRTSGQQLVQNVLPENTRNPDAAAIKQARLERQALEQANPINNYQANYSGMKVNENPSLPEGAYIKFDTKNGPAYFQNVGGKQVAVSDKGILDKLRSGILKTTTPGSTTGIKFGVPGQQSSQTPASRSVPRSSSTSSSYAPASYAPPPSPAQFLQSSKSAVNFSKVYNDLYNQLGLGQVKANIDSAMKQLADMDQELIEKTSEINANPWLTEGIRIAQINKLQEKYELKRGALASSLELYQSLFDSGREDLRYMTENSVNQYNKERDFAQDQYESALNQYNRERDFAFDVERESARRFESDREYEQQNYEFATEQAYRQAEAQRKLEELNTQIVEFREGGSYVTKIVDKNTGKVLATLGSSPIKTGSGGSGSSNKLTLSEAREFGLPDDFVGLSEEEAISLSKTSTPPDWFKEMMEQELQQNIFPSELQIMWDEYREGGGETSGGDVGEFDDY